MFSMDSPAAPTPAISSNRKSAVNSMRTSAGSSSRIEEEDGYFSTKAGSSQTSSSPSPQTQTKAQLAPGLSDLGLGAVVGGASPHDQASQPKAPIFATEPAIQGAAPIAETESTSSSEEVHTRPRADSEVPSMDPMSGDDSEDEDEDSTGATPSPPQVTSPPATQNAVSTPQRTGLLTPGTSSSRPSFYSRPSRSMVNLSTSTPEAQPAQPRLQAGADILPIRSRERPPTKITIPARLMRPEAILTPSSEWKRAPPTPGAGFAGYMASRSRVNVSQVPSTPLARRRSMDDLLKPPPEYEPPLPGTWIPRPRDEEGKEKLPGYWCAVSTVHCLLESS